MNYKKLFYFSIILSVSVLLAVIFRYEELLSKQKKQDLLPAVQGGALSGKVYSSSEIIKLIAASKEYIGDSITIFDNGEILSANGKFQGTINAVIHSEENMEIVHANTSTNKLPLQYNVYVLAATYYRQQYPEEFGKTK